ncbi:type IV secretory system conjugative DNA transfer family protein [Micromonospora sp. HNM0581]|uniref:TraM recognition domain-containing protein n=1 Tax=Micromonospora sp. HNM0581 TaxID=2716341 RepID=UPI00146F8C4A|nr:type IV secretory system conjugative DNA transfer family protein [Micromonospora sp. HNM0581]
MSRPGGAGGDYLPWLIPGVALLNLVIFVPLWLGGILAAMLTGHGWQVPPFTVDVYLSLLGGATEEVWPGLPSHLAYGGAVTLVLLGSAPTAILIRRFLRRLRQPRGLARAAELSDLTGKGIEARARQLRPGLKGVSRLRPDDTGNLLGDLVPAGPELRSSYEDIELDLMAPRSGKSTCIAVPRVLRAPGAVLLTSNKSDVFTVTRQERSKVGRVWTFDPQGIAYTEREMWWDMLSGCDTVEGARRLAGHFVGSVNDDSSKKDFWIAAAQNTLMALFLAASRSGASVNEMLAWLADPADRTPIDLLRDLEMTAMADQLQGTVRGAVETRDGIYETARQCVACLLDPQIVAWVSPDPQLPQFIPAEHVLGRDTLYLLSKDGGGSAAGVIAGLADAVVRAGVVAAERMGGRLDPPLTAILDEAANVCRISDLPDLYSHLGSRGISVVTLLQSYRQGVRVWGEVGMDALWSAATIKLLGAGLDDADFVDKVAKLVGQHDVRTPSYSRSREGSSRSVSYRQEQVLPADKIRALPKGTALLLATGVRPALIRLRPWYREPNAAPIAVAAAAEVQAITERAAARWRRRESRRVG